MLNKNCRRGFSLAEIMIVVAMVSIIAAIILPGFVAAKKTSEKNACINNLKKLNEEARSWCQQTNTGTISKTGHAAIERVLYLTQLPEKGPGGGSYIWAGCGTEITCSITDHVLTHLGPSQQKK